MVLAGLLLSTWICGQNNDTPRPADADAPNGPGMTLLWSVVGGLLAVGMFLMI